MIRKSSLRLLSYNIQAGLSTERYSQYFTHGWRHILPAPSRMNNLDGIAEAIAEYDIVALQEVDTGSLRSGFVNQVKYLAAFGGFPYLYEQNNRKIGALTQHSNAVLTRFEPDRVENHRLPGLIPGRGALRLQYGQGHDALHVLIMHLALGKRDRRRQMRYVAELIGQHEHLIVMGDLNCRSGSPELVQLLESAGLSDPRAELHTFPSWRPTRQLDHILVSPSIHVEAVDVLPHTYSDHLPIAMQVRLPHAVPLAA